MKKGKMGSNFSDGRISDGVASMRFDSSVRRRILEHEGKDSAVTMSKCEIKHGRHDGDGFEVHIRNSTEVAMSEKKFDVSKEKAEKYEVTGIKNVESMVQYQRVIVEGKVVELDKVKEVSGGKKKQDMVVADSSGSIRLTIWEEMIGQVAEGLSYRFTGMMVRMFKGKKFLSTSKTESNIEVISDIGEVEVDDDLEVEGGESSNGGLRRLVKGVKVVGVDRFTQYSGCFKCSSKWMKMTRRLESAPSAK